MYTTSQMIQIYSNEINLKKINKQIYLDLKHLCQWLKSNKISLNASKTEIKTFKHKQTIITKQMNFRVSGKKMKTITSVKYLGVHLNDSLTWETHLKNLIPELNRTIGLLFKVRFYTPKFLYKIYTILSLIRTAFILVRFGDK